MKKRILAAILAAMFSPAFAQSGFTDLGATVGTNSIAYGVSADGTVVVGTVSSDTGPTGFRWENGAVTAIGASGDWVAARAVSADGQVIAGTFGDRAFRWKDGLRTGLGTLGGLWSDAYGVNQDGNVVVGESYRAIA